LSAIFTLTTENLTDTHYNSQSRFSVGANIGLTSATKDPKPDTKNTQTPSGTKEKKGTGYFLSRRMANRNCHSNKGFLKHLEIVEDRKRMKT